LSELGIVVCCILEIGYGLIKPALIEQRPPLVEASVGRTETAKAGASARPTQRKNDKKHEKLVFHDDPPTVD